MWWSRQLTLLLITTFCLSWVQCCQEGQLTLVLETCDEYNECIQGSLVRKRCELGKYFNGIKCDHIWNVKCNRRPCKEGMVYQRGICSNEYDVCFNGRLQRELCPTLYRFDGKSCIPMETCKNELNTNVCTEGDVSNIDGISYVICENGEYQTKYCPAGLIFRKLSKTCEPVTINLKDVGGFCEENDRRPLADCSKYEECINGHYQTKSCPENMLFDKNYLMCRFSYEATCFDESCAEKQVYPNLDSCQSYYTCHNGKLLRSDCGYFQYYDPVLGACTYGKHCERDQCTGDWTKVSSDCTEYTVCNNGYQIKYNCPLLSKYNEGECRYFASCEHPNMLILKQESECQPGQTRRIPGRCSDYEECGKNKKWHKSTCKSPLNFQTDKCEDKPCPLSPVLNHCDQYKDHTDGDKIHECQFGYRFDKIERQCVHYAAARCASGECTTPGNKTNHPTDCHKYEQCDINGKWEVETCPWYQWYFDSKSKECTSIFSSYTCKYDKNNVKTVAAKNIPGLGLWLQSKCTEGERKLIENTCRWYTECKNGSTETKKCSPCQNFNVKEKKCDWVWRNPCGSGVTDPPDITIPPTVTPTEPTPISHDCDKEGEKEGVPSDCRRYRECIKGNWADKYCTTIWGKFDIITKSCFNWATWKATCSK